MEERGQRRAKTRDRGLKRIFSLFFSSSLFLALLITSDEDSGSPMHGNNHLREAFKRGLGRELEENVWGSPLPEDASIP